MRKVSKVRTNGVRSKHWHYELEPGDKEFILANYKKMSIIDMSRHFGCSSSSLLPFLNELIAERRETVEWTAGEDDTLRKLFLRHDNAYISKKVNHTVKDVSKRARTLGLRKDFEYMQLERELTRAINKKHEEQTRRYITQPCCGRFCPNKTTCRHYKVYIAEGKPTYGLLYDGHTTRCIGVNLQLKDYLDDRQ